MSARKEKPRCVRCHAVLSAAEQLANMVYGYVPSDVLCDRCHTELEDTVCLNGKPLVRSDWR